MIRNLHKQFLIYLTQQVELCNGAVFSFRIGLAEESFLMRYDAASLDEGFQEFQ